MRKSSTILEELNENKELAKATGLAADEKDFIEGEIADLEKEYEAAIEAEKNTPAPKKKEAEPATKKPAAIKKPAPVEKPAETPKKEKKAKKTQDDMAFIIYKGKKIYENEPEYCEKSIEAWKERKAAQKKAAGKYKTKPVIQKVASNIVSAVAKGIDSIKHDDIKDNPKEAIKTMEQLQEAGKQFLETCKNILGEKLSDKAIKEEFEGLDETIKKISEKYLAEKTKFENGGEVKAGDKVIITTKALGNQYEGMIGEITDRKLLNDKYSIKLENGLTMAFEKGEFKHNSINPKFENGGEVDEIEEGDIVLVKSEKLEAEVIRVVGNNIVVEFTGRRPEGGDKRGQYKLKDLKLVYKTDEDEEDEYANGGEIRSAKSISQLEEKIAKLNFTPASFRVIVKEDAWENNGDPYNLDGYSFDNLEDAHKKFVEELNNIEQMYSSEVPDYKSVELEAWDEDDYNMETLDDERYDVSYEDDYGKLVIQYQHVGKGMNYAHKFIGLFFLDKYTEKNISNNPDKMFSIWTNILDITKEDLNGLTYEEAVEKITDEANLKLQNSITLDDIEREINLSEEE